MIVRVKPENIAADGIYSQQDYITKTNRAWAQLRDEKCKHCRGFDGGFRFLCSHPLNSSKVVQDARLNKRCALPWCPHQTQLPAVANGRASWMNDKVS